MAHDSKSPAPRTVLVLCTGNSCRSQMAEAFLRRDLPAGLAAASAGSHPAERVHPMAVRVMAEKGLDLSGHTPKPVTDFLDDPTVTTVIAVCEAAAASCPVWPGDAERLVWPFDDPAGFEGSDEETLAEFRRVRDAIAGRIGGWLAGALDFDG